MVGFLVSQAATWLGSVADMSTGGEVANALVCKTSIHGFKSHPVLQLVHLRVAQVFLPLAGLPAQMSPVSSRFFVSLETPISVKLPDGPFWLC
jgi:hypothetical protein